MAALFRSQFASGFPGGRSKEQGCTIAADESGRFHAVSPGGLNRGESHFEPDLEMRQEELYVLGAFHTHPHDASPHNVSGVSLSGGDIVALVNIFLILAVVQSGTRPFAFVRARLTPRHVPPQSDEDVARDQRQRSGQAFQRASHTTAQAMAVRYNLAYHRGSGRVLTRV